MKALNTFTGGIISDIDYSEVKPNQTVFPTSGFRVFNKDGKGFIATLVPGNVNYFNVTDGFVILGACEYNGIGFILSYNPQTGYSEIGSFPSPELITPGFNKIYKPLKNFSVAGGPAADFRTKLLNFDLEYILDVKAKVSYDNSVDIYFADYKNTDKVVNCGFKLTGESNNRIIKDSYFNGRIDHIVSSLKPLNVAPTINIGGSLQPGNYFLYIRYLTDDYVKTNFVKEVGPISISRGTMLYNHSGLQEKEWIIQQVLTTDKKIQLQLSNVDTSYTYIQVGVIRYSNLSENAPATKDSYLVDKYFVIDPNSPNLSLEITGIESRQLLTFDEIVTPINPYKVSRSRTQVNKRLLRANLKKIDIGIYRDKFRDFAQLIRVTEDYNKQFNLDRPFTDYVGNRVVDDYSNDQFCFNFTGYFKEQIYPFGIVLQFTDGTESEAYPVQGNIGTGSNGLYKFRSWEEVQQSQGNTINRSWITYVRFQTGIAPIGSLSARDYWDQHRTTYFKDVVGFYFVRGERIDNFICQGLMLHAYHGIKAIINATDFICSFSAPQGHQGSSNNTTEWDPTNGAEIPLFRGALPTAYELARPGVTDEINYYVASDYQYHFNGTIPTSLPGDPVNNSGYTLPGRIPYNALGVTQPDMFTSTNQYDHRHGLFSPDMLFELTNPVVPEETYVQPIFSIFNVNDVNGLNDLLTQASRTVFPKWDILDIGKLPPRLYTKNNGYINDYVKVKSIVVNHNAPKGKYNFIGYFSGYDYPLGFNMNSQYKNRNIGVCRYVGIQDEDPFQLKNLYRFSTTHNNETLSIVNQLKYPVNQNFITQVDNSFNVGTTFYGKISSLVILDNSNIYNFDYYKGDCFLQKTWFRSHRWYAIDHPDQLEYFPAGSSQQGEYILYRDQNGVWYQHGLMIGVLTEMVHNSGMRNEVSVINDKEEPVVYTFFPKCLDYGIEPVVFTLMNDGRYLQEALQVNDGYNITLSRNSYKGYEPTEPERDLRKPNRVDASDVHIPGSFIDGYRNISAGTFQDYALEDGDIYYIGEVMNMPFIVQRNGINQIFTDERSLGQGEGDTVILGMSQNFFSPKPIKIASYGTQHKSSVVKGFSWYHGFDFQKRVWWIIGEGQSPVGAKIIKTEDVTLKLLVLDEFIAFLDQYSKDSTNIDILEDKPLLGKGITSYYDPQFKEVGMSFFVPSSVPGEEILLRTYIFNEKMQMFWGNYPFVEPFYFNIGNLLLSQHHRFVEGQQKSLDFVTDNDVYKYNQELSLSGQSNYNTFFGTEYEAKLSFITTGYDEKENLAKYKKMFNAQAIEAKDEQLLRIEFETQYQRSIFDFQTTKFWIKPEYKSHTWLYSVTKQTSLTNDQYSQGSEMMGFWLKTTLVYKGNKDPEIKIVATDFTVISI